MIPMYSDDWSKARPAVIPEPTYWPAALALGAMLLLWGLLTSWMISVVGLGLFSLSLSGWIRDILREHRKESER
jgi:hypothetical protein